MCQTTDMTGHIWSGIPSTKAFALGTMFRRFNAPPWTGVVFACICCAVTGMLLRIRFNDGHRRSVDELVQSTVQSVNADTLVVLMYDPTDLFSCGEAIGSWKARASDDRLSVRLVLLRNPSPTERRQLLAMKLRPDSIVLNNERSVQSTEVLLVGGRVAMRSRAPNIGYRSAIWRAVQGTTQSER